MICGDCLCVSGKDNKCQRIPPIAGSVELASVFKSLRLSNPTNYNVYLVGSRLWGTDSTGSDWDLLVVGDLPPGQLTSLHKSQYDVKLLDRHEFRARVKEGSIIEVVCAMMRKEDMMQVAFELGDVVVDPDAMKANLEARQTKDMEKAEKFWLKGNRQPGWKILRHILHATALYHHLAVALRKGPVILTIDEVHVATMAVKLSLDEKLSNPGDPKNVKYTDGY